MKLYSFVLWSPKEISLPEYLLVLDPGCNAFNLTVEDIEAFKETLTSEGVDITQINELGLEPEVRGKTKYVATLDDKTWFPDRLPLQNPREANGPDGYPKNNPAFREAADRVLAARKDDAEKAERYLKLLAKSLKERGEIEGPVSMPDDEDPT